MKDYNPYQPEYVADKLYAEMQERDYRKKAWDRKKHWSKDSTYSVWERIGIIFGSFTFALAVCCFLILNVNWKAVARWFNDLETWQYSVAILFLLCVISVSWTIVRSAKKG